jgi:hypothetical protein
MSHFIRSFGLAVVRAVASMLLSLSTSASKTRVSQMVSLLAISCILLR